MGFLDSIGKSISDVGQTTIKKGKEMADAAKLNSLISEEERKLVGIYEQIGRHYVKVFGDSPEEPFAAYFDALRLSKGKIAECQQKLRDIKGVSKCPACGAEIPNGSLFCVSCGTKIVVPVTEGVHCAGCGATIPPGSKFCTSCGKPAEMSAAVSKD